MNLIQKEPNIGKIERRWHSLSDLFSSVEGKVFHLNGVDSSAVIDAEKKLGMRFSDDFRNYLMEYGVVSFKSHELMGLGGDDYLNVVLETLSERGNNDKFPINCYIVENLGIYGVFILQDEDSNIYEYRGKGITKIFDCLKDYVVSIS